MDTIGQSGRSSDYRAKRTTINLPIAFIYLTMVGFSFSHRIGPLQAGLFIATWGFISVSEPRRSINQIFGYWLPWLFPLVAAASIVWSAEPLATARASTQLAITVGFAMLAAHRVSAKQMVRAAFLATLLSGIASVATGNTSAVAVESVQALIGVYASKNSAALYASVGLVSSLCLALDRGEPRQWRIAAILGILIGAFIVIQARSAAALIGLAVAISAILFIMHLTILKAETRRKLLAASAFLLTSLVPLALLVAANFDKDEILEALGKDSTLTGRTYLWEYASHLISRAPYLGIGYQAFWVHGNVEAEGLWRYAGIASRMGFHFHSIFYQTGVENGYLGIGVFFFTLSITLIYTILWALRQPGSDCAFFLGMLLFLAVRAYQDVEFNYPFYMPTFIFAATWHYAQRSTAKAAQLSRNAGDGLRNPGSRHKGYGSLP